ncbi:MAG: histidine kinase [Saprospiraceae bacterium]|nr:histidine kinase [Saprospiraceae bacterium]
MIIGIGLIVDNLIINNNQISFTLYVSVIIGVFLTIAPRMNLVYKTRLFKAEYDALKAQMNPHFMGNCFNSIINLVEKSENDKATHYLTTLYGLFQKMIEKSESGLIPISQEIEICQRYLALEELRFEADFNYQITCKNDVDNNFYIPPLLLQPLLENAILHGLRPKQGDKQVNLNIEQNKHKVICVVEDNGVGRQEGVAPLPSGRQPMGIRNIQERLRLFKKLYHVKNQFYIEDKQNEYGEKLGTKVTIEFEWRNQGKKLNAIRFNSIYKFLQSLI